MRNHFYLLKEKYFARPVKCPTFFGALFLIILMQGCEPKKISEAPEIQALLFIPIIYEVKPTYKAQIETLFPPDKIPARRGIYNQFVEMGQLNGCALMSGTLVDMMSDEIMCAAVADTVLGAGPPGMTQPGLTPDQTGQASTPDQEIYDDADAEVFYITAEKIPALQKRLDKQNELLAEAEAEKAAKEEKGEPITQADLDNIADLERYAKVLEGRIQNEVNRVNCLNAGTCTPGNVPQRYKDLIYEWNLTRYYPNPESSRQEIIAECVEALEGNFPSEPPAGQPAATPGPNSFMACFLDAPVLSHCVTNMQVNPNPEGHSNFCGEEMIPVLPNVIESRNDLVIDPVPFETLPERTREMLERYEY